jgi:hypothetical protein
MASEPGPWFDPVNCAFCKQFANEPGLLNHMHHEYHQLHNGMMQITHVDAEFEAAFTKAQVGVGTVVRDMQAGKPVTTCRHCSAQGALFKAGVMPDLVKRGDDYFIIFTSSDTTLIKQIQEFGKNSSDALAAVAVEKKPAGK